MKKHKKRKRRVVVTVHLAPSRQSTTPFCAYYGPQGQTCSVTDNLRWVWRIPGPPGALPRGYMACPEHYAAVEQAVTRFLAAVMQPSPDEQS